jgi:hypothetical protein
MGKWILIASCVVVISAVTAVFIGQARESTKTEALIETLVQRLSQPVTGTVDFDSISGLPPPVARYFKHVLTENQKLIKTA